VQARTSMSAEHTITSASGGQTTGTMTLNNVISHGVDSSLDLVAGNYVVAFGEIGGVLNITNQGDMFLQDPVSGCVANGEIAIMNSNFNVYDVRMLLSNCTGSHSVLNGVTFGGLAEAIFENTFTYADGVLALLSEVSGAIAAEVQRGQEILITQQRDVPEHHRSMQVVFDRTWERLTDDERRVFSQLSVFRGGFRRAAAQDVAEASLAILAALVNKSFCSATACRDSAIPWRT